MYKRKRSYSGFKPNKYQRPRGIISGLGQFVKPFVPYAINYFTRRQNIRSGAGVTSQYDTKWIYRKKNMNRRKKKAWGGFVKKVRAALMKDVGTKTVVFNHGLRSDFNSTGQQAFTATLYGADGDAPSIVQCGSNDIRAIFTNDAELTNPTSKAVFMSGCLDITMVNMSTKTGTEEERALGLEVDIYDIGYYRKFDAYNPREPFLQAATDTLPINGLEPGIEIYSRGATPWDLPDALSKGIKIFSKKKFFLGKGETATYQLRNAKNYSFNRSTIDDTDNNFVIPKVTRTLMIIVKGLPWADGHVNKSLQIGTTRKYMYKVLQDNVDKDNHIMA